MATDPRVVLCGVDADSVAVARAEARIGALIPPRRRRSGCLHLVTANALAPSGEGSLGDGWAAIRERMGAPGGFDVVIANPPWGADISLYRERLSRRDFSLLQGQFDTSDLFMELALSITRPGGYIAFIVPDSLFNLERTSLRKLLLQETQVRFVGRFGERIFSDVNRACAVVICRKGKPDVQSRTECLRLTPEIRRRIIGGQMSFREAEGLLRHSVAQERLLHNPDYLFDIDITADEEATLRKFRAQGSHFRDHLWSSRGVELSKSGRVCQCGACGLWVALPSARRPVCRHCGASVAVTPEAIVRITSREPVDGYEAILTGESVRRYHAQPALWIDTSRQGVKYKDRNLYRQPKLVVRKTGVGISAAMDYSGAFTNQVVYIFRTLDAEGASLPLEFFLGLLNSRALYYYLVKSYGETEWRSHPYLTQTQVLGLPLPAQFILNGGKKHLVLSIAELLKAYTARGEDIPGAVDARVERMVAELYGLTRRDYGFIYSTLEGVEQLIPVRALRTISIRDIFAK